MLGKTERSEFILWAAHRTSDSDVKSVPDMIVPMRKIVPP